MEPDSFCQALYPKPVGSIRLSFRPGIAAEDVAQESLVRALERWDKVAAMEYLEALPRTNLPDGFSASTSDTWDMAEGPGDTRLEGYSLIWAGDQLVRWGGGSLDDTSGKPNLLLSNHGWIWTPPIKGLGTASTTSSVAPTSTEPPATTGPPSPTVATPSTSASPTTSSSDTTPPSTLDHSRSRPAPGTAPTSPTSLSPSPKSPAGEPHATP